MVFLEHMVSKYEIKADLQKVKAVTKVLKTHQCTEIRNRLSVVGNYRV